MGMWPLFGASTWTSRPARSSGSWARTGKSYWRSDDASRNVTAGGAQVHDRRLQFELQLSPQPRIAGEAGHDLAAVLERSDPQHLLSPARLGEWLVDEELAVEVDG